MDISDIDLTTLEQEDLDALEREIGKERRRRKRDAEKEAQREIKEVAKKYGLSFDELINKQVAAAKPVPRATYVHPDDPSKTWTGRGRRPKWINEWLEKGRDLEELKKD